VIIFLGIEMNTATVTINGAKSDFILNAKEFKTGSSGFHAQGKLEISPTERYQVNILCVKIGSKPKPKGK